MRAALSRGGTWVLALAAIASGVGTFAAVTGTGPFEFRSNLVPVLVTVNLGFVLLLAAVVLARLVRIVMESRRGAAAARLHVRLAVLFGAIAVVPTILVSLFSAAVFDAGLQTWFSDRVRSALEESLQASRAYLAEHQQAIRGEAQAMVADLSRASSLIQLNPRQFNRLLGTQAQLRNMQEATVFDAVDGRVIAHAGYFTPLGGEDVPSWAMTFARDGEVAVMTSERDDRVRALVRLDPATELFLVISRPVNPRVLGHMERTERAVVAYQQLDRNRSGLQLTFALIFAVLALLILLAAVVIGLMLANRLARPVSALMTAAERVRGGDLAARVPEGAAGVDELGLLSRSFNRMTGQLEASRDELMEAYRQLDARRRFTEGVLASVSAGVIGLDAQARISIANRLADDLLGRDLTLLIGAPLADAVPEFAALAKAARDAPDRTHTEEVTLAQGSDRRILLARILADTATGELRGFVLTFDDVTELLSAQRKAAWADVARRIAHEIKNPLTPIQLSAERLKRRYLKEITSDPETFKACTDTIVRQVGDIGRMVDEFSAFARMPQPVLKPVRLGETIRQAVFLQREAHPAVTFSVRLPEPEPVASADGRMIGQALTNLLANAADAVGSREGAGNIAITVEPTEEWVAIVVEDDGIGLPEELRARLTEPYVTTKVKGTGLGLAIVRKIAEEHRGRFSIGDRTDGGRGARAALVLKREHGSTDSVPRGSVVPMTRVAGEPAPATAPQH